jgi:hypothetical protein
MGSNLPEAFRQGPQAIQPAVEDTPFPYFGPPFANTGPGKVNNCRNPFKTGRVYFPRFGGPVKSLVIILVIHGFSAGGQVVYPDVTGMALIYYTAPHQPCCAGDQNPHCRFFTKISV